MADVGAAAASTGQNHTGSPPLVITRDSAAIEPDSHGPAALVPPRPLASPKKWHRRPHMVTLATVVAAATLLCVTFVAAYRYGRLQGMGSGCSHGASGYGYGDDDDVAECNCAHAVDEYDRICVPPTVDPSAPVARPIGAQCPTLTSTSLFGSSFESCQDAIGRMFVQCEHDAGDSGGSMGCATNEVEESKGLFSGGTKCENSFNWFPYTGETSPQLCEIVSAEITAMGCMRPSSGCPVVDGKPTATLSWAAIIVGAGGTCGVCFLCNYFRD
eukprot:SAG31_NODE_1420_length_8429_cov_32.568547_1_plen_272_part_00